MGPKNIFILLSVAHNIASLFDLEACPANLVWVHDGKCIISMVFRFIAWNEHHGGVVCRLEASLL
jgi:hypothetical protein